jgi:pyroglutamyl-peptidase
VPLLAREGTSGITLEKLVEAGEAILLEMVKLARQASREVEPTGS